jgi:hypothetical protein
VILTRRISQTTPAWSAIQVGVGVTTPAAAIEPHSTTVAVAEKNNKLHVNK